MYKKILTLPGVQGITAAQKNFPLFVQMTDPELRLEADGGRVCDEHGRDFFFTLPGEQEQLVCDLVDYQADTGRLKAWVLLPELLPGQDVQLVLFYGGGKNGQQISPRSVWDDEYLFVGFGKPELDSPGTAINLEEGQPLTVEAWIHAGEKQMETIQPLVSMWQPLPEIGSMAGYDASNTGGLDSRAYFGAVFDGRYIYFSPQHYENREEHGVVLRLDTHGEFHDPHSYAAYDAGNTDGLHTCGFYGAAFDGRFVYFVPRQDYQGYHTRALRYDTQKPFQKAESWEAYDAGYEFSKQGVAFDGRYLYFCPGFSGDVVTEDTPSAQILRFDTQAGFKDSQSWQVHDAAGTSGLRVGCFDGGGFDGRFIYFAPLGEGIALQYDAGMPFQDSAAWKAYDGRKLSGLGICVGVVYDGKYMYYVPYAHGNVVRFDTSGDFSEPANWQSFDAGQTGGLRTSGFDGGFFDGRYVYFAPFVNQLPDGRYEFHANFLRYDTLKPFNDPTSWDSKDGSLADGVKTVGYNAGAYDGRYFYLAPWRDGTGEGGMHGRVLRVDTTGEQASFSLRAGDYGHNGGLCAALIGPSFWVNTTSGHCFNAFIPQPLEKGLHYLAGVFDGENICLYIDGQLANRRQAIGKLLPSNVPLEIGQMAGGASRFDGKVAGVRVSKVARSADWVLASSRQVNISGEDTITHIKNE